MMDKWLDAIYILWEFFEFQKPFLDMLTELNAKWVGHLGRIFADKH